MTKVTRMSNEAFPILYHLLRAVRTLLDAPGRPGAIDPFGAPLAALHLVEPYPAAAAHPAALATDAGFWDQASGYPLIASEVCKTDDPLPPLPHEMVVFLDVLRLLASPVPQAAGENISSAGGDRSSETGPRYEDIGALRPGGVRANYLLRDRDIELAPRRNNGAGGARGSYVRRAFMFSYAHVLLRRLATVDRSLAMRVTSRDKATRVAAFNHLLSDRACTATATATEAQRVLNAAAARFVQRATLDSCFPVLENGRLSLAGLFDNGTPALRGAPTRDPESYFIRHGGYLVDVNFAGESAVLPESLVALLLVSAARFGGARGERRIGLLAIDEQSDTGRRLLGRLSGAERHEGIRRICEGSALVELTAEIMSSGASSDRPTSGYVDFAAFCVVLERFLLTQPWVAVAADQQLGVDDIDQRADLQLRDQRRREEKIDKLVSRVIKLYRDAQKSDRQGDGSVNLPLFWPPAGKGPSSGSGRFMSPSASRSPVRGIDDIRFDTDLNPLDFIEGQCEPIDCHVFDRAIGDAPPGALFLPIPRSFDGLPIAVQVIRPGAGDDPDLLLDFSHVDSFMHGKGALHWFEPDDWADPDLPPGLVTGQVGVAAWLFRCSVLDQGTAEGFLCVIVVA